MAQLSDRLNRLAPSATLAMSQKSSEMNSATRNRRNPTPSGCTLPTAPCQRTKTDWTTL